MAKRKKEWHSIGSTNPRAAAWHARNDAAKKAQLDRDIAAGKIIRTRRGDLVSSDLVAWRKKKQAKQAKRLGKIAVGVAAGGILASLLFR